MHMFFGIPQRYTVDIYGFYFEEYILGYLCELAKKDEYGVLPEYLRGIYARVLAIIII